MLTPELMATSVAVIIRLVVFVLGFLICLHQCVRSTCTLRSRPVPVAHDEEDRDVPLAAAVAPLPDSPPPYDTLPPAHDPRTSMMAGGESDIEPPPTYDAATEVQQYAETRF